MNSDARLSSWMGFGILLGLDLLLIYLIFDPNTPVFVIDGFDRFMLFCGIVTCSIFLHLFFSEVRES